MNLLDYIKKNYGKVLAHIALTIIIASSFIFVLYKLSDHRVSAIKTLHSKEIELLDKEHALSIRDINIKLNELDDQNKNLRRQIDKYSNGILRVNKKELFLSREDTMITVTEANKKLLSDNYNSFDEIVYLDLKKLGYFEANISSLLQYDANVNHNLYIVNEDAYIESYMENYRERFIINKDEELSPIAEGFIETERLKLELMKDVPVKNFARVPSQYHVVDDLSRTLPHADQVGILFYVNDKKYEKYHEALIKYRKVRMPPGFKILPNLASFMITLAQDIFPNIEMENIQYLSDFCLANGTISYENNSEWEFIIYTVNANRKIYCVFTAIKMGDDPLKPGIETLKEFVREFKVVEYY